MLNKELLLNNSVKSSSSGGSSSSSIVYLASEYTFAVGSYKISENSITYINRINVYPLKVASSSGIFNNVIANVTYPLQFLIYFWGRRYNSSSFTNLTTSSIGSSYFPKVLASSSAISLATSTGVSYLENGTSAYTSCSLIARSTGLSNIHFNSASKSINKSNYVTTYINQTNSVITESPSSVSSSALSSVSGSTNFLHFSCSLDKLKTSLSSVNGSSTSSTIYFYVGNFLFNNNSNSSGNHYAYEGMKIYTTLAINSNYLSSTSISAQT